MKSHAFLTLSLKVATLVSLAADPSQCLTEKLQMAVVPGVCLSMKTEKDSKNSSRHPRHNCVCQFQTQFPVPWLHRMTTASSHSRGRETSLLWTLQLLDLPPRREQGGNLSPGFFSRSAHAWLSHHLPPPQSRNQVMCTL